MKKLNNLPDTLSQEQILELFKQYQEGNLKAKETILVHNIKLIINLVLIQFNYPQYDVDELICVGLTSLTESIDNYDITRKANFSTFARFCAKNKIISYLKRNNKHTKNISLNTTLYTSFDGDETTIEDTLQDYSSDIQTDYEDKEEIQIIRDLVNLHKLY